MAKVKTAKSFEVTLFINGVTLTAGEVEAIILGALDKVSIIADVVDIKEVDVEEVE